MTFVERSARLHSAEKEHASFAAFRKYSAPVWKNGALTHVQKHLVAIAAAHLSGCEFCIENHARQARSAGAHLDNALDAGFVVSALLATRHIPAEAVVSALSTSLSSRDVPNEATPTHRRELRLLVDRVLRSTLGPHLGLLIYSQAADSAADVSFSTAIQRFVADEGVSSAETEEATAVVRTMVAGSVYGHSSPVFAAFED